MADALKDSFGTDVPGRIAGMIQEVHPTFGAEAFVADALDGYEALELTSRARHIAGALARHLPPDPEEAIPILLASLGPKLDRLEGMESFVYLPHVFYVAEHGLDTFETSMHAQYELTQRFTAEFSIGAFLDKYPDDTLARLREWAADPSPHVRRLVSEGTRPRLPWAPRLRRFQTDPTPVLELLELLKDDPAEYVRRSVANNLNDIAKDHPDVVVEVSGRWLDGAPPPRRALIRHALRTLVKQGHAGALGLLGFGPGTPVTCEAVRVTPPHPRIGERVAIEATLRHDSDASQPVLVDLRIHFVKANGTTRPKVFKGAELHLPPGETGTVRKTVSLAQHTTRTHYPGRHGVEVLVNGEVAGSSWFKLRGPDSRQT